jgi:hypothetical protein
LLGLLLGLVVNSACLYRSLFGKPHKLARNKFMFPKLLVKGKKDERDGNNKIKELNDSASLKYSKCKNINTAC